MTPEPGWQLMTRLAHILITEHHRDPTGRCATCPDEPAPCPIAELAGVGLTEALGLTTPHRRALRSAIARQPRR